MLYINIYFLLCYYFVSYGPCPDLFTFPSPYYKDKSEYISTFNHLLHISFTYIEYDIVIQMLKLKKNWKLQSLYLSHNHLHSLYQLNVLQVQMEQLSITSNSVNENGLYR
jgi:hypothetical protein